MKLLITGKNGNLAQSLQKLLGYDFIGIGRNDNLNLIDFSECDVAIHCASDLKTSLFDSPESVFDSNLISTCRLLELVKKNHIKKIIFVSSCSVYGNSRNTEEQNICVPVSINGHTKLLNEKIIESYCNYHNIEFVILRVFNLYGGDDKFSIIYHLKKCILENKIFKLNNDGVSKRDFINVNDVVAIINHFIKSESLENIYNVGTGCTTRIIDIFHCALKYFPDIKYTRTSFKEVEYSCANIDKLRKIYSDPFINAMECINELYQQLKK